MQYYKIIRLMSENGRKKKHGSEPDISPEGNR
jgi:hypothetical protein